MTLHVECGGHREARSPRHRSPRKFAQTTARSFFVVLDEINVPVAGVVGDAHDLPAGPPLELSPRADGYAARVEAAERPDVDGVGPRGSSEDALDTLAVHVAAALGPATKVRRRFYDAAGFSVEVFSWGSLNARLDDRESVPLRVVLVAIGWEGLHLGLPDRQPQRSVPLWKRDAVVHKAGCRCPWAR